MLAKGLIFYSKISMKKVSVISILLGELIEPKHWSVFILGGEISVLGLLMK